MSDLANIVLVHGAWADGSTVELASSHVAIVSHSDEVATLIRDAAQAAQAGSSSDRLAGV